MGTRKFCTTKRRLPLDESHPPKIGRPLVLSAVVVLFVLAAAVAASLLYRRASQFTTSTSQQFTTSTSQRFTTSTRQQVTTSTNFSSRDYACFVEGNLKRIEFLMQ